MRWKTIALLFALAALFAGCGDDDSGDSGDSGSTETLTKAEFIEQGNAICAEGNKKLDKLFPQAPGQPGTPAFDDFAATKIIPNIEAQVRAIDELPAPEGDEEQVDAIISAADDALAKLDEDPSLIAGDVFAEANRLASDYGLTVCGAG